MLDDVRALSATEWRCIGGPRCVDDAGARARLVGATFLGRGTEGVVVQTGAAATKLRVELLRFVGDLSREIAVGEALAPYPPLVAGVRDFWLWQPQTTPEEILVVLRRRFSPDDVGAVPPWADWTSVLEPGERERARRASVGTGDYDEFATRDLGAPERFVWAALEQPLVAADGGVAPRLATYIRDHGLLTVAGWPRLRPLLRFLVHLVHFMQYNAGWQHSDLSVANVLVSNDGSAADLAFLIGYPEDDLPADGVFPVIIDMGRAAVAPRATGAPDLALYPTGGFVPSFDLRWLAASLAAHIFASDVPVHDDLRALVRVLLSPPSAWAALLWNPVSATRISAHDWPWNAPTSMSFAHFMRELLAVADGLATFRPGRVPDATTESLKAVIGDLGPHSRFALDHTTARDDSPAVPGNAMRLDVLQPRRT